MNIVAGKVAQLAFGALIGAIIGGIVTGDENYILLIALGVPLVIVVFVAIGAVGAARRVRAKKAAAAPVGINATLPRGTQTEAVLNPVSTAQPSPGVVLNGQVVDAPTSPRPAVGRSGGSRIAWRVLGIVTIAVGAALSLLPAYQSLAWIGHDVVAGRPFDGRDMRTGLHQQEAFDQLAASIGSTEVTSIYFFEDYVAVSAPTSPGARTVDRWVFRYGRVIHEGADYSQPDDIREEVFDAGGIDMSLVAALTNRAIDEFGRDDYEDVYPSIRRFSGEPARIGISISNDYFDGSYEYTLDGELIRRSGSAFD